MSQWMRDERGLLYSIEPDGSRFYNPPSLAEQKAHGNHDSFFRDEVWDVKTGTYKKKTNWNNIAALGAGGAVGAGAISGAMAGGGAATAAPMTTQAAYDAGMFGAPGGTAAGVAAGHAGLGTGGAGAAGAAGGAAGGAGAAGGGLGHELLSQLTSGHGIAGLAGLLTTLATRPSNGGGSGNGFADNSQLQGLLDMSYQRAQRTDPLHQAITQLAMSRLPTNVQR